MQLSLDTWEVLEKREWAVTEPTRSLLSKDTKLWQDSVDAAVSLLAGAPYSAQVCLISTVIYM
jgi:hypothetical protein